MDLASSFLIHSHRFYNCICFEYAEVDSLHSRSPEEEPNEFPLRQLSYGKAIECFHHHVRYLYEVCSKIDKSVMVGPESPWVIAYLSHNSIDYMLSTLAVCSDKSVVMNGPQILPVLLPTKWTVPEIVQILQLPHDGAAVTILLHDTALQAVAQQVQQKLVRLQHAHIVNCIPLPTYAHDWILQRKPPSDNKMSQLPPSSDLLPKSSTNLSCRSFDSTQLSADDAVILFTSGTTSGQPLGVRLNHRAIYVQSCAKRFLFDGTTRLMCHTVPFYHVGGLSNYLAVWVAGGTLVQPLQRNQYNPVAQASSFDAKIIFQCWSRNSNLAPNSLVVVPAMLDMMQHYYYNTKETAGCVFPQVQCILIGGQSASSEILHFLRRIFPNAQLVQTYASTETSSSITFRNVTRDPASFSSPSASTFVSEGNDSAKSLRTLEIGGPIQNQPSKNDPLHLSSLGQCVGRPPAHVELFLWKEDHEKADDRAESTATDMGRTPSLVIQTPFTPGVIVTRGPHVMNGYWSDRGRLRSTSPSEDRLLRTGFFVTNDIGFWDTQGALYYLGRRTDTIRTGAETVWCTEVEQVVQEHPRVVECAVFGISDARFGEAVCCAVVLPPEAPDGIPHWEREALEELRAWCRHRGLAGYKCPRHLLIRTAALPRNANGKVLKYQLQEQLRRCLSQGTQATSNSVRLLSKL